ncbi:efflux RND transporter periplasmic adaptor subunit [Clostridium amazonitimonense]|uniref:efflux RND transporter periplasmic adaptor subunit n=1 Tax=Clostridium amazonitimonense TaxID=1499689 RepID=UPI000509BE87|nr:efflux RND transporter periplasmic adaptor subunit [Clostridium amazonitimonense]
MKKEKKNLNPWKKTAICSLVSLSTITILSGCNLFPKEEAVMAPPLIKSAQANLNTAKVELGTISHDVNDTGYLVPTNIFLCAFDGRSGYLKNINVAPGDSVSKGDVLAQLDSDDLENKLKQQEIRYKKVKLRYDSLASNPEASDADKQNAKLDLELEELQLQNTKTELSKTTLVAPTSGIITYKADLLVGDMVRGATPLFAISNTSEFIVEYSGENLKNLKVGMEANCKIGDDEIKGTVSSIDEGSPVTSFLKSTEKKDKKQTAIITLESMPKEPKLGAQVQLEININKKSDVLIVPKSAVKFFNQAAYVKVVEKDDKVEKFIKMGIDNGKDVEILEGLEQGQEIIIN